MNPLPISLLELETWLANLPNNQLVGFTHSSSHHFLCNLLHSKFSTKAVFVHYTYTKICKLGNWQEFSNPSWLTQLTDQVDSLHNYSSVTIYNIPPMGKKINKIELLNCISLIKGDLEKAGLQSPTVSIS